MSTRINKGRASDMLARLRANRFLILPEPEIISTGVPYELRRSSQDEVLREIAGRQFNKYHTPPISKEAFDYWGQRDCWCRESASMYRKIVKRRQFITQLGDLAAEATHDFFAKPPERKKVRRIRDVTFWWEQIHSYTETTKRFWEAVPDEDKLRFFDPIPMLQWACHYPTLAVVGIDHTLAYWPEGTPEHRRQLKLLEWCIAQGDDA